MRPKSDPPSEGSLPAAPDLARHVHDFRLLMSVIDRENERALDRTRDRYGRTVHAGAEATARAHREQAAVEAYTAHLAPCADALLEAARRGLDDLPPARHLAGWRGVLDGLAVSASEIRRTLDQPAAPGSAAERAQHRALWPYLTAWADHGVIASNLADQHKHQHHKAPLTGEEQHAWTERAQAAQKRGALGLVESWYSADGQLVTLAHLIENDDSTVITLRGDPNAPGWQVTGHYADEYEAGQVPRAAAPPGVLRADVSEFNRPELVPEVSLQELIRGVVEARHSSAASNALLGATQRGYDAGPMIRLQELLETAGKFAGALETVQGQQIAARLSALGRQVDFLTREVHEVAEDLGATVAVLPPHRAPVLPRGPRAAVDATPPTPPPRAATIARHR